MLFKIYDQVSSIPKFESTKTYRVVLDWELVKCGAIRWLDPTEDLVKRIGFYRIELSPIHGLSVPVSRKIGEIQGGIESDIRLICID